MITVWHFNAVGAVLFALGLTGVLTRRNLITMFLSAELMLQGVVLTLLAYARLHADIGGQVFALFVITVAACEAGIAMALFIAIYRGSHSLDVTNLQSLRESGISPALDDEPLIPQTVAAPDPILQPAGAKPKEVTRV